MTDSSVCLRSEWDNSITTMFYMQKQQDRDSPSTWHTSTSLCNRFIYSIWKDENWTSGIVSAYIKKYRHALTQYTRKVSHPFLCIITCFYNFIRRQESLLGFKHVPISGLLLGKYVWTVRRWERQSEGKRGVCVLSKTGSCVFLLVWLVNCLDPSQEKECRSIKTH